MTPRRQWLAAALIALAGSSFAQSPSTRIIVSFAPGGPVDSVARALTEQLGKELGTTVVVENKPGANGAIGAMEVARAAPDGRTIWITSVGAAAINPVLYDKLPYDMQRDFAPVSLIVNNVELLVVNADDPAKSAPDLVTRSMSLPKGLSMASSGIGSIPHLAIEQLADGTGAKLVHIPFNGAAPAITNLMGGQVGGFFGDVPGLIGHVKGGKLKALGIAAPRRHPALPDVPTLEEQGIKGVDTNNWYAFFVAARTPAAVVDALNRAVRNTLATPAIRDRLLASGAEPQATSPQELAALVKADTDKWARLIKAKGIKVE
jgi:tripartite-type tricarboxylate transporter receptor subunit TctC